MRDVPTPHEVLLSEENHQQNAFIPQSTLIPLTQIDLRARDWEELGYRMGWLTDEYEGSYEEAVNLGTSPKGLPRWSVQYSHAGRLFLQSLFPTSRSVQGRGSQQIVMTAPSLQQGQGGLDGVGMAPDLAPPTVQRPVTAARAAVPVVVQGVKRSSRLFGFRNGR
jgi:hypothetical protein